MMLPTPAEILAALDQEVVGQDAAKRTLAMATYKHLLGVAASADNIRNTVPEFGQQHTWILGPTGVGKTLIVKQLARKLHVPVAFTTATSLVETGYVGDRVESTLEALLAAANGDVARASFGIVFIDEIDKIKRSDGGRDVHGEGVQNALLPFLDGVEATVGERERRVRIDTSTVLFVCAGAFVGLERIVAQRLANEGQSSEGDLLSRVKTDDLVNFGFIPEFVGRFTNIRTLDHLTECDFRRILTEARSSVVARAKKFFTVHGTVVSLTDGAIAAIAKKAVKLRTGARGLDTVLADVLRPIEWRILEAGRQVRKVVVSRECVTQGKAPRFIESQRPPEIQALTKLRTRALRAETERREVSDTSSWSESSIRARIEDVKGMLEVERTTASARKWFDEVEQDNKSNPTLFLQFLEELLVRDASIDEFFAALLRSKAPEGNLAAGIHFLDYWRIKVRLEKKR